MYLEQLHDRNEVLYFRLLGDHLPELLPIVYDPTVLGLGPDDVDLVVATDAEQLLGIGDWGVGGMQISVGKLAVYTAAAGIHPGRAVPVMLDVGTGNQTLLNDPLYLGNRHNRVRGEAYDAFVAAFVEAVGELFPQALLHWEDFGPGNGRRILQRYGEQIRTFNDDMQGVVFGAGTAGVGIADQLRDAMVRDGLDREEATRRIWCVDRQGLLRQSTEGLRDYQRPYARPDDEWPDDRPVDLPSVVDQTHPTVLVGTSTQHEAFTQDVVRTMARRVDRPVVLPLSNPTLQAAAEAVADLADLSEPGTALLPEVGNLRTSSAVVAAAVARRAAEGGVARARLDDVIQQVQDAMWQPEYV